MKQRQITLGNNPMSYDYEHCSDTEEENIDSIPLLSMRHVYTNGERTSPSRRSNQAIANSEPSNAYISRVIQRPVLEAQVQETDTLQAIALRFHCSVEELKRLNNIHRENEIFAHSVLKVPITPHSILLGTLPKVHQSSGNNSPKTSGINNNFSNMLLNLQEVNDKLMSKQPIEPAPINEFKDLSTETVNDVIFNSTVVPNSRNCNDTNSDLAETHVKTIQPILNLNGTDCGLKWYHLLIIILLLAFIIPLIYVFYIAEHLERYNHSNTSLKKDH